MKTATKHYAEGYLTVSNAASQPVAASLTAAAAKAASGTYTFSADEAARMKKAQAEAEAQKLKQYEVVTIGRGSDAYAKFVAAFNSAVRTTRSGGNTYAKVNWNSSKNRTDLSYFVNTYITKGQSWDATGSGCYYYLKHSSGYTDAQLRLVRWANFWRDSYEWFRNLPEFSMNPDGEKLYRYNDTYKLAICVDIPYNANKTGEYFDVRQERRSMDIANDYANSVLDQYAEGDTDSSDKTAADTGQSSNTWLYIAAGILAVAVVLKIIKKKKGK